MLIKDRLGSKTKTTQNGRPKHRGKIDTKKAERLKTKMDFQGRPSECIAGVRVCERGQIEMAVGERPWTETLGSSMLPA